MNYNYIESLLLYAKNGDSSSLEKLIEEFTPLIKKLSRKTFIPGYTSEDLQQECIISLLKSIEKYNPVTHRFVAYATNSIRNNLNYLIRSTLSHKNLNGPDALTFTGSLEDLNLTSKDSADYHLLNTQEKALYWQAIKQLTPEEQELFAYVNLKNHTLKSYAELKNISYSLASKRKQQIMKTLINFKNET